MVIYNFLIVVTYIGVLCNGARILGIFPTPAISHQSVYQPLWRELAVRGHNVTVITPNPINETGISNLKEININAAYAFMDEVQEFFATGDKLENMLPIFRRYVSNLLKYMTSLPEVQDLVNKEKTPDFDLVIVEALVPHFVIFSHGFNCTVIGISSVDVSLIIYELFGNPFHPVLYPDVNFPVHKDLSFWERCSSSFQTLFHLYYGELVLPCYEDPQIREYFRGFMPHASPKVNNLSLLMLNNNVLFDKVRPNLPNVISISGIHIKSKKPLPNDLERILDEADRGVIYFSLGTNVKSKYLADGFKRVFLDTFAEFPYLVLWKSEDDMTNKSSNVIVQKWFPQNDILGHRNVKLFITQCGLQSIEESVLNRVPLLGIPIFGDQLRNGKTVTNLGIGKSLNRHDLTSEALKEAIDEIISDRRYVEKIEYVASLMEDEPMKPLDKAVWWTEYILRHKGAPHLRNNAVNIPWYQFLLLDVAAFVLLALSLVIVMFTFVIYSLYKMTRHFVKRTPNDSKLKMN